MRPEIRRSNRRRSRPSGCIGHLAGIALLLVSFGPQCAANNADSANDDWKADWEIDGGFSIEIDTQGYALPVNIAFVTEPGKRPDDPLYFIVELRGSVKVVTNDRTVHLFAQDITNYRPPEPLPPSVKHQLLSHHAEGGAAGICLDQKRGNVFVTYAYTRDDGTHLNEIVRFDTQPGTFALAPVAERRFSEVFRADPARPDHQIGSCQVFNDELFVGVGDSHQWYMTQDIDVTYGKLLRMDLDGRPLADNPFYASAEARARNYVWAYGLPTRSRSRLSMAVFSFPIMGLASIGSSKSIKAKTISSTAVTGASPRARTICFHLPYHR